MQRSNLYRNIYDALVTFTEMEDLFAVDFGEDDPLRFPAAETLLIALEDLEYLCDTDRHDDGTDALVDEIHTTWQQLGTEIRTRDAARTTGAS